MPFVCVPGKLVGFIGLGNMGNSMAANLMKKGHSLIVYDIQSAATEPFKILGAKVGATPAEVAAQADRIVTMLPASPHVRNVYSGPNGILE
jgi:3-hydroxyisobutyrate dehydrogenase-like beta-hydroxyacid dehydrogenase